MHSATENGPRECDGFHNQGHISSLRGVVITTLNRCCLKPEGDSCNYAPGGFWGIIFCHALVMSLKRIARAWRRRKPKLRHVSYMPTDSKVCFFSASGHLRAVNYICVPSIPQKTSQLSFQEFWCLCFQDSHKKYRCFQKCYVFKGFSGVLQGVFRDTMSIIERCHIKYRQSSIAVTKL